jgi:hypothetical protein
LHRPHVDDHPGRLTRTLAPERAWHGVGGTISPERQLHVLVFGLLDHHRQHFARQVVDRGEVHPQDVIPMPLRQLVQRHARCGRLDACIVHQHIDPAMLRQDQVHRRLALGGGTHINPHERGVGREGGTSLFVHIQRHHYVAVLCKGLGHP